MATLRGPIWSDYHRLNIGSNAARGIELGLAARQATIFFRRLKGGQVDPLNQGLSPNVNSQPEIDAWRDEKERKNATTLKEYAPNVGQHTNFIYSENSEIFEDYVALIDVDAEGPNKGYEIIKFPAIPKELEWNTESAFAAIKPIGRNTPFYHYTGSEDKLEFEIDWYSTTWDKREVIRNCRRVESLAKADGYSGGPHRVMLKWGDGDVLFSGIYFQVISASYRLTRFNKARRDLIGVIESAYMLPVQAYQKVVLARIDEQNITSAQIKYVNPSPL